MLVEKALYDSHRPVGTECAFFNGQFFNFNSILYSNTHSVPTGRTILKYSFSTNILSLRDNYRQKEALLKTSKKPVKLLCGLFKQPARCTSPVASHQHLPQGFNTVSNTFSTRARPRCDWVFSTCKHIAAPLLFLLTYIHKIIIMVPFTPFRLQRNFP